ncbi:Emopamil-binding protein [Niveomyces insectorum RCEF 264]|uniref:Emopamil-binding protein n=1 Tax=Niveomyces insectorum RCEF 264 TaxID=1081102 RepID=A0A162J6E3_9HYPO|nr:Emopamil-binding protein [Niveomyces insectorum RCEF 264]
MPGGALHWPLWAPYALYGEVDHVYGFKQWHARNGFTAAQGALNLVETLLYLGYVYLWWAKGATTPTTTSGGGGGGRKGVTGRAAAYAVMLAFSAAVMTLSKTVLYWLNEYFSYFDNIGHNDLYSLVFLWIIPNGLWLVFPTYVIYQLGGEIVNVLAGASADDEKEE